MSAPSPSPSPPPPSRDNAAEAAHDATTTMRAPSAPYLAPQGLEGLLPDPHAPAREAALEQQILRLQQLVEKLSSEIQELRKRVEALEPRPRPQGQDRGPDR